MFVNENAPSLGAFGFGMRAGCQAITQAPGDWLGCLCVQDRDCRGWTPATGKACRWLIMSRDHPLMYVLQCLAGFASDVDGTVPIVVIDPRYALKQFIAVCLPECRQKPVVDDVGFRNDEPGTLYGWIQWLKQISSCGLDEWIYQAICETKWTKLVFLYGHLASFKLQTGTLRVGLVDYYNILRIFMQAI